MERLKWYSFIYFLLMLPSESFLVSFAKLLLLAVVLVYTMPAKPLYALKRIPQIFLLLLLVVMISLVRSNNPFIPLWNNIFRGVYFAVYMTSILFIAVSSGLGVRFSQIFYYIILRPSYLFFGLNILLWLIGVGPISEVAGSEGIGKSIFLSFFGIDADRVQFPLAEGFNNYGAHVSFIFAVTLSIIAYSNMVIKKGYLYIGLLLCSSTLLFIDSRSAIIIPIMVYLILKATSFGVKKVLLYSSLSFVIIGPILLTFVLPLLESNQFLGELSRDDGDIFTGNSRTIIWSFVLFELADFKIQHLFGYGDFGHFGSGISMNWEFVFSSLTNGELKTPHNTMLSLVLDCGYIGLLLYILVYGKLASTFRFLKNNLLLAYIIFAVVFFNVFNGITETLFGFYFQNYIYILLSAILLIFLRIDRNGIKIVNSPVEAGR